MRFTVRELVYIGIFGALWGTVEITSGSILHVFNVPFAGVMLSGVGIAIALIGRLFVPRPGSVLFIGLVTACLKVFSLGGIVINPMIGIVMESLLAEVALTALRQPRRGTFVVAGGLATLWPLIHPFFTQGILAGVGVLAIYTRTITNGAKTLGFDPAAIVVVLVALIVIHLLIGCAAGLIAWDAGRVIQARLRPTAQQAA
jgi:ABC-type thiamin/hydroxymethylpyrimidine transport system permease subunit